MLSDKALLFRIGEECTLRLHAIAIAYPPPADHDTLAPAVKLVSAERLVQPFFVPYKNASLLFQLSLWSCVRFTVCLGMIFAT